MQTEKKQSPIIQQLIVDYQKKGLSAIDDFWAKWEEKGTPIIEPDSERADHSLVSFVYQSTEPLKNLVIFSDLLGQNTPPTNCLCENIAETMFYYRTYSVLKGMRTIYTFSKNNDLKGNRFFLNMFSNWKKFVPDPFNSKIFTQKYAYREEPFAIDFSILEVPPYTPKPWILSEPLIPQGTVKKQVLHSSILKKDRVLWVYTPANYEKKLEECNLAIIFDGRAFLQFSNLSKILDSLIFRGDIPPTIAIFVHNFSGFKRMEDLSCYPPFAATIATELLPWVESKYRCSKNPSHRVLVGSSSGGLGAIFLAWKYPHIFPKVLAQSPYLAWQINTEWFSRAIKEAGTEYQKWWTEEDFTEPEWLISQFANNEKKPIQFYLNLGELENSYKSSINRFISILENKSYDFRFEFFPGSHEYINWAEYFGVGMKYLIGSSQKENI
jgi:enterochelin esterase-like enzyme